MGELQGWKEQKISSNLQKACSVHEDQNSESVQESPPENDKAIQDSWEHDPKGIE